MACIENNILPGNADSEMEEGEIVDDLDGLSDISSEEEFLLRQRLQVLENYNNVLERKKAKNSYNESGKLSREDALSHDLSEISDTDFNYSQVKTNKRNKGKHPNLHKYKRKKPDAVNGSCKTKDHKRKLQKVKKKTAIKIISESSEESEDEYRDKRRKLANAVSLTKEKNDTSSLKARLKKMLCGNQIHEPIKTEIETDRIGNSLNWCINSLGNSDNSDLKKSDLPSEDLDLESEIYELIDLCEEDNGTKIGNSLQPEDCVDSGFVESKKVELNAQEDSDEDLELLRQYALKTKTSKTSVEQLKPEMKPAIQSEDEDSDTAELRAICLKSALLKKAIEMKRKQKLRKRLSQSIQDDFILANNIEQNETEADNNTDIESVDMDIGSDGDEKLNETSNNNKISVETQSHILLQGESTFSKHIVSSEQSKEDEIEEDEDLLRAKLLTSLSKNLPNLVDPSVMNNIIEEPISNKIPIDAKASKTTIEEKPFIIKLGGSDSEGEHEATKNLTKMHMKLSEQVDFQQKLDLFLKSTRMEVEKKAQSEVIQEPPEQKKATTKFVAKVVKHLPKSEQIEYKNLVKRMTELEKIKQARQSLMNSNNISIQAKETLKPRNVTIETPNKSSINDLEQLIAMSRKKIAEESSKMLKLKEEGTKLSQKHKIVATELRNITTAITLNKKEQKIIQNRLSKIRHQHQLLLIRSPNLKQSINNLPHNHIHKNTMSVKLQKENNPEKDEYKNPINLKSVKVNIVNDLRQDSLPNSRLSVEVDVSNNKKTVKIQKTAVKAADVPYQNVDNIQEISCTHPVVEKGGGLRCNINLDANNEDNENNSNKEVDDYKSPLEALETDTWVEDPNTFLCPFEVGGTCKDPDCKHLHPKIPSNQ